MADRVVSPFRGRAVCDGPGIDEAEVRRALALLADGTAGCELRGLRPARSLVRHGQDVDGLIGAAAALAGSRGLYLCLNPVRADLGGDVAASDEDVTARRWLFVDLDPVKSVTDDCASDQEKAACLAAGEALLEALTARGWPEPVVIDSGNGCYLLYRILLPNDEQSRELCRGVLHALAALCGAGAKMDRSVHNASRIARLPGTWNRKGTATLERPHRLCRLMSVPEGGVQVVGREMLEALAGGEAQPPPTAEAERKSPFRGRAAKDRLDAYCRRVLSDEVLSVAMAGHGSRNNSLNEAAFALGTVLAWGVLDEAEVQQLLGEAALRAGLDAREIGPTIQSGLEAGRKLPRPLPAWAQPAAAQQQEPEQETTRERGEADVARIGDLIAAGAQVDWLWEGWIQRGVLTALAAEGGKGKTRFCADLVRRIVRGEEWPDGQIMMVPADARALWVVADNNHDEIADVCRTFGIVDSVWLNAWRDDPYGGVSLDEVDEVAALDRRIGLIRPALVVIDTVGNSTDRNLSRQEEAKAYYQPLQLIARKHRCAVLCLTHLNATGKFLGRRVLEKVRVAVQMSQPDPQSERRRLWVAKTNSRTPPPLGVTLLDSGNKYDTNPPAAPEVAEPGQKKGECPPALARAAAWLAGHLEAGPKPVGNTRTLAESQQIDPKTLYRARDYLHVEEYEVQGRKWWRLTATDRNGE